MIEVETILPYLVIFIGLCFGSLATLISWRLPRSEPIGMTRSQCPTCKNPLAIRDLVPVLSWVCNRGTCRQCKTRVHWRYPATEIASAIMFFMAYAQYGVSLQTLGLLLLAAGLMTMFIIDFEHYIIPDSLQWYMGILGGIYHFTMVNTSPATVLMGMLTGLAIGASLKYGFLYLRKKDGLGMGDVKFLLVAGIWLGAKPLIPMLFFSGVLGIATAGIWRLLGQGERFPFGPALGFSMFLILLYPQLNDYFWDFRLLMQ